MVQPLRDSRDHYEELKQIDDAMTEVEPLLSIYLSIYVGGYNVGSSQTISWL